MSNNKEIIKLLKSGDFTLAYHDNGYCEVYRGKIEYDDIAGADLQPVGSFDSSENNGYIPAEVSALVNALGGKAVTT
jgi:hypothetical protein